ncbi:MAG: hypothetical protein AAFR61_19345 [Bacteroidota bacterium]
MHENHQLEQYFFDEETLAFLARQAAQFKKPCFLCAPLLGQYYQEHYGACYILDIDDRFAHLPGFIQYDIYRPEALQLDFDLLFCDPPFFNVSLSQLFKAMRLLCQFDFQKEVVLCYLKRRERAITGAFHLFSLEATDYFPTYQTLVKKEKNHICLYTNGTYLAEPPSE